jgi:hypothetical protein
MTEKVLREKISLQNHTALPSLADWWNEQALGSNEIFNKYPEHFVLYYNKWRKTQSEKEALRQPIIQEMIVTLENAAGGTICPEITRRKNPSNVINQRHLHGSAKSTGVRIQRTIAERRGVQAVLSPQKLSTQTIAQIQIIVRGSGRKWQTSLSSAHPSLVCYDMIEILQ